MKMPLRIGWMALSATITLSSAAQQTPPVTLTIEEALRRGLASSEGDLDRRLRSAGLEVSQRKAERLPVVRAEGVLNDSRTSDVFAEEPFELQSASVLLAFEYPILDGGLNRARHERALSEFQRLSRGGPRRRQAFEQIIGSYGELYSARKRLEFFRQATESLVAEADRSEQLLVSGQISQVAVANSRDHALSARSELIAAELAVLESQQQLKALIEINEGGDLLVELDPGMPVPVDRQAALTKSLSNDPLLIEAEALVARDLLALKEAESVRNLTMDFSGFVGISAARSNFGGTVSSGSGFGIYGARLTIRYPLFDRSRLFAWEKARVELERSRRDETLARQAAEARFGERWTRVQHDGERIPLLEQAVSVARQRQESLQRLVSAGARSPSELAGATAERARKEAELVRVQVERWRLLQYMAGPPEGSSR